MSNRRFRYNFFALVLIILIITPNISNLLGKTNSNPDLFHNDLSTQDSTLTIVGNQTDFTLSKQYEFDDRLGAMKDIMIQDNLAYVAVERGGLMIFNISNLEEPVLLGSYYETGLTSGVFVREDVVFVADGTNGLLILNVSNPVAPFKIGEYSRTTYRVFVENNYAYIRSPYDALLILNITDLSSPSKISEDEYLGFREIYIKDGIMFLPRLTSTFIVNVTNSTNQEIITILSDTNVCAIQNEFLITTGESKRLVIYNLTTLPTLTVVANYTLPLHGTAKYITTNDDFAFIGSTEEIMKIDITEITNPINISKITNLNWYYDVDSNWISRKLTTLNNSNKREILLFTDYQRGLFIYNSSKTEENSLIGFLECGMRAELIAAKGEFVYIISRVEWPYYPAQLEIYTFIDSSLQKISNYLVNSSIWDFYIDDGFVFLVTATGIDVVDISNPTNPTRISYYYHCSGFYPNWNMFYDSEQKYIYLCGDSNGLLIINASNLTDLTLISQVSNFQGYLIRAFDVYIKDDIAFVADGQLFGGFGLVDVSDPKNPEVLKYVPLNRGIIGIIVESNFAYLTSESHTLEIFDVSDVSTPIKHSEFDNYGISQGRFVLHNNIFYLAQLTNLTLINITDSSYPNLLGYIRNPLSGLYVDVFIDESQMYLACAWTGLEVWNLPNSHQPVNLIKTILYIMFSVFSSSMILVIILVAKRRKDNI
jgi:hypothetical protein